jgi:hypothetical protein
MAPHYGRSLFPNARSLLVSVAGGGARRVPSAPRLYLPPSAGSLETEYGSSGVYLGVLSGVFFDIVLLTTCKYCHST